jgi:hypothetical protein
MILKILSALFVKNTSSTLLKISDVGRTRKCSKCHTDKPLDKIHYQVVQYFSSGFSYYCNDCDTPKYRT